VERQHEDLAVADVARARRQADRLHRGLDERVRHGNLEARLLLQRHLDSGAAVVLDVLRLAAVALHAADGDAAYLGAEECLEHAVEPVRPDNRDDQFHARPPSAEAVATTWENAAAASGPTRIAPSPSA